MMECKQNGQPYYMDTCCMYCTVLYSPVLGVGGRVNMTSRRKALLEEARTVWDEREMRDER